MTRVPHIVVVDDEPEVRGSLAEYLTLQGFRATEADGAPSLRRIVAGAEPVDLVLPEAIAHGKEPFCIVGAMAGG